MRQPPFDARLWLARPVVAARLLGAASVCVLALPLALLHARALAEILIACIDGVFLVQAWTRRDWGWLRQGFVWAAGAWFGWQIVCSALGTGGLVLALVAFRLPLLAVALGEWVLARARARRMLWWAVALAASWIVLESWQQYLTGANLFGVPRFGDGALTGPFNRPRAGPALILILFPVLVPSCARLLAFSTVAARLAGLVVGALGVATVLLIAQRMPSMLLVLGLCLTAALLPRLRLVVAGLALMGVLLVAAAPVVAPAAYHKLIVRTQEQVSHFVYSPYGEIWVRAAVIAGQHPWRGLGFDGFRRGCGDPGAVQGLPALGVSLAEARLATDACNIHPHNYYLEAADNGGVPLLVLFGAMVGTAWWRLARGIRAGLSAMRVGLLVGFTLAMWPVASTSGFTSMPNAGWIFLLLGLGFAEARDGKKAGGDEAITRRAEHALA
jgi:O-antigen ligase